MLFCQVQSVRVVSKVAWVPIDRCACSSFGTVPYIFFCGEPGSRSDGEEEVSREDDGGSWRLLVSFCQPSLASP